ncbi:MAG: FliH/SctL family protein, partial [Candidatus Sericytochromatia bacterium]
YNIIGLNYEEFSDLKKAIYYYERGIEYANKANDIQQLDFLHNNLGNVYFFRLSNPKKGLIYYLKCYEYSKQNGVKTDIAYAEVNIADANMESGRIIQTAEDQHQDILESATQDGFSVGYQEGKEEALKENSELLRETLNALNKLYAAFPVAARQNEEKIVRIAYQISDSVLGEPVQEKPDLCVKVFDKAIQNVSDLEQVRIKVNPADLDILLPKQEYFKYVIPDVGEFVITGDRTINKGNCVITAKSEEINVSINTQISILESVFNEALEQEQSGSYSDYEE